MNYLVNALASHEIHVARYYMKRSAYVAAANRAQYALKTYPQAPANEEGLLILVQAYDKLGMTDLRNDAERVMKTNFPESKYLTGKGGSSKPWWQIWNGVGQRLDVLHRPAVHDVAHRELDDLAALGARDVGDLHDLRRHVARRGVVADLLLDPVRERASSVRPSRRRTNSTTRTSLVSSPGR